MNEIKIEWCDYERKYSVENVLKEMVQESTAKDPESFMIENSEQIESFQNAIKACEEFENNDTETEWDLNATMQNLHNISAYYKKVTNGNSEILKNLATVYFRLWYRYNVERSWQDIYSDIMDRIFWTIQKLDDMRQETLTINID